MQRTYHYRGFVATVGVELLPTVLVADSVVASGGFLVKVGVRHPPSGRELPPALMLNVGERPFATEAEALMAGFSFAQRLIENAPEQPVRVCRSAAMRRVLGSSRRMVVATSCCALLRGSGKRVQITAGKPEGQL
jgi:hypothetical protein